MSVADGVRDRADRRRDPRLAALPAVRPGALRGASAASAQTAPRPTRAGDRRSEPRCCGALPHIDYAGLSPLIALTAGTCADAAGRAFPRPGRARARRCRPRWSTLAAASGLSVWQFGENKSIVEGALRLDDLALSLDFIFYAAAAVALVLSLRERPPCRTSARRLLRAAARERHRHGRAGGRQQPGDAVPRHRAAVDPAVRDVRAGLRRAHVAGGGAQVPGDRLGRLRDAALRARVHLRRDRLDRLRARSPARSASRASSATRCC